MSCAMWCAPDALTPTTITTVFTRSSQHQTVLQRTAGDIATRNVCDHSCSSLFALSHVIWLPCFPEEKWNHLIRHHSNRIHLQFKCGMTHDLWQKECPLIDHLVLFRMEKQSKFSTVVLTNGKDAWWIKDHGLALGSKFGDFCAQRILTPGKFEGCANECGRNLVQQWH